MRVCGKGSSGLFVHASIGLERRLSCKKKDVFMVFGEPFSFRFFAFSLFCLFFQKQDTSERKVLVRHTPNPPPPPSTVFPQKIHNPSIPSPPTLLLLLRYFIYTILRPFPIFLSFPLVSTFSGGFLTYFSIFITFSSITSHIRGICVQSALSGSVAGWRERGRVVRGADGRMVVGWGRL